MQGLFLLSIFTVSSFSAMKRTLPFAFLPVTVTVYIPLSSISRLKLFEEQTFSDS